MLTKCSLLFKISVHFSFVVENNINSNSFDKNTVFLKQNKNYY